MWKSIKHKYFLICYSAIYVLQTPVYIYIFFGGRGGGFLVAFRPSAKFYDRSWHGASCDYVTYTLFFYKQHFYKQRQVEIRNKIKQ